MKLFNVTFDCRDAAALAGFWSQVLDQPLADGADETFARVHGEPNLLFLQVPDPTPGKNRVHVDLDAARLDDARTDLEGLGATFVAEREARGLRWLTFRDPEGNEFCVGSPE